MSRITTGLLASEKELKMGKKSWEGSAKDTAQDKKLAKKHGMSMSSWEKSSMDTKHDTQQSTKGLRGGGISMRGKGLALKKGGSIKEAGSGEIYASKAAMKKHEAAESPAVEKAESKMRGGGIAMRGKGIALKKGGKVRRYADGGQVDMGSTPAMQDSGIHISSVGMAQAMGGAQNYRDYRQGAKQFGIPKDDLMSRQDFRQRRDENNRFQGGPGMGVMNGRNPPALGQLPVGGDNNPNTRNPPALGQRPVQPQFFKKGGMVKKSSPAKKRGGGMAQRGVGIALRGGGRAKGCM